MVSQSVDALKSSVLSSELDYDEVKKVRSTRIVLHIPT